MNKRRVLIAIAVCAALAVGSLSLHWQRHSMAVARAYTAGDSSLAQHVLIATQGSAFKDALVSGLVKHLSERGVYVQVIDISGLPNVRQSDWSAIVLVHTWQFGRPPREVRGFIDGLSDRHRIVAVTTSGSGRDKLPGVDAISGASVLDDVPARLRELNTRVDALLAAASPAP